MDSLDVPAAPAALTPVIGTQPPPRIWKFWGTALWGLFIFAGMFIGQIGVVAWLILRRGGPIDIAAAIHAGGGGPANFLSLVIGFPGGLGGPGVGTFVFRPRVSALPPPSSPSYTR